VSFEDGRLLLADGEQHFDLEASFEGPKATF
jgi:hypothetical protein